MTKLLSYIYESKFIKRILQFLILATMTLNLQTLKYLTVFIYDFLISFFFTITSHLVMAQHMTFLTGAFLDVGCGTGSPLQSILPSLLRTYNKVVGIDMDSQYVAKAKNLFKNELSVSIYEMNFYEINQKLKEKFNFIFFSFSYMLMQKKIQALQIAKQKLNKDGRIAFILTLNKTQNKWLEKLKPLIRKITTIDFGEVVYEAQFKQCLKIANLQIVKKQRIQSPYNIFLKLANVYYIETIVKQ